MAIPKLSVASLLSLNIIQRKTRELGAGRTQSKIDCVQPATSNRTFHLIKFNRKIDAFSSFGVSMDIKCLLNPQLTLRGQQI